jgi:putative hydrolase of the HAD superfamily
MVNLKGKSTIIFDLGNVLLDINLDRTLTRFKQLGIAEQDSLISRYKQSGIFCDLEDGKISKFEFAQQIRKQHNLSIKDEVIFEAWSALLGSYKEERIEMILKLKQNFRVLLLSNTNEIHIKACGYNVPIVGSLNNLFHQVYYSYKLGVSKPHKEIFEILLKKENIKPSEALFLDDSIDNIKAAEKLGIDSWWVEHPDDWVQEIAKWITG